MILLVIHINKMLIRDNSIYIGKIDLENSPLVYPSGVTKIYWYTYYPMPSFFPPNIKHIYFGYSYIYKIANLPDTVTHLSFDSYYPNNLEIPDSVTHLKIHRTFDINKPIKLSKNIRVVLGINITDIPFIVSDNNTNIETIITNTVFISKNANINYNWLYYLIKFKQCITRPNDDWSIDKNDFVTRCGINRHNMRIKQTAFYDVLL